MLGKREFLFFFCAFISETTLLYCQNNSRLNTCTQEELRLITEGKFGLDDLLYNGLEYHPENIRASGNSNFEWDNSLNSLLFVKGHAFKNANLIYDINLDQLILTKVQKNYLGPKIILNSTYIDSFYLGNNLFINLLRINKDYKNKGYFEKIFAGNSMFLKKHKKRFVDSYDFHHPYGKFSPQTQYCFLYNNGNLIKVNSKKEFLGYYAIYKKKIRRFLHRNKIKYRKASNQELFKLMIYCEEISNQIN